MGLLRLSGIRRSISFVFLKQKAAYELRISDWSSDVCSSDLLELQSSRSIQFIAESLLDQGQPETLARRRLGRGAAGFVPGDPQLRLAIALHLPGHREMAGRHGERAVFRGIDRKSTRLNSSH